MAFAIINLQFFPFWTECKLILLISILTVLATNSWTLESGFAKLFCLCFLSLSTGHCSVFSIRQLEEKKQIPLSSVYCVSNCLKAKNLQTGNFFVRHNGFDRD